MREARAGPNYMAMRDYVFPAKTTRLLAFLHIGAAGQVLNRVLGGELQDIRLADPDRTADTIKENPGFLLGVKVRMFVDSVSHWEAHTALRLAREAADKAGVKLMVHISHTPLPLPDILEQLRPGDIATHIFNGNPEGILDENGGIRPEVKAAAQRGVVMDVAHAGVHCDVEVAIAALRQGFFPTTISTDIHNPPPGRVLLQAKRPGEQVSCYGPPNGRRHSCQHRKACEGAGPREGDRLRWRREWRGMRRSSTRGRGALSGMTWLSTP